MGNFILFTLVLFILAALLRIDFFFTILYLFAGVYILLQFWSRRMLKHLQISRSVPERAFLGDQVTVTLRLKNISRLPIPWLLFNEILPSELTSPPFFREVITLDGKRSYSQAYTLMARKRGYYKIGPLMLQSGDLLGLKQQMTARFEADPLIVYPKILPMSELGLPTHSPQVILPTPVPLFQDPARIIGVRDYVQGDSPRHIHWPATAATGQLLVKQFQPAIARDNAIFLNLSRADYARYGYAGSAIELAIVTAASLAHHMIAFEELPVGLLMTAVDPLVDSQQRFNVPPRKGRSQLMQILEILARVQAIEGESDFLETVRQEAVRLSWGTTILMITSEGTQEILPTLLFLKRAGFQVTLILIQSRGTYMQAPAKPVAPPQALNCPVFRIGREKDVEAWVSAL